MFRKIFTLSFLYLIICQSGFALQNSAPINIIPKPDSIVVKDGWFSINPKTEIISNNLFCGNYLKDKIEKATGYNIRFINIDGSNHNNGQVKNYGNDNNLIFIIIDDQMKGGRESYKLSVEKNKITITASAKPGAFYGIQTLLQLLPPSIYGTPTGFEEWIVPMVEISDGPRFPYRGFMLDVSRTFFDIGVLYKYVDWLSYHKINTFHLHLSDDNGWRIEIKKYPLLTQKGAWRGPGEVLPATFGSGNKRYGGFYTQKEMKALVKYAMDRNIEIIPEIDLPGHSKALAACYPDVLCKTDSSFASVQGEKNNVLCVSKEDNYKMIDNIIKELVAIFPSDYIHVGGDEVNMDNWMACPDCSALMQRDGMKSPEELHNYFMRRIEKIVLKYGKKMAGWDEIIDCGSLNKDSRVYAWRRISKGIDSAKKEHPTIMQIGEFCYLDMKQSYLERGHNWAGLVPLEKVYSFDPAAQIIKYKNSKGEYITDTLSVKDISHIIGTQVGLWTELLNKPARFIEYQTFPRICASAEVGWTNPNKKNWDDFYRRLTKVHYERLYNMGIAFRLQYPDIKYIGNSLKVGLPYEWAIVRYTSDGSEPNYSSTIYTGDIVTYEPEKFRFATFYKDQLKSITVGASNIDINKYITPEKGYPETEVTITTNMESNPRFPVSNAADYNYSTYFRSSKKASAGDYFTYTFKNPLKCSSVKVKTGIPKIDLYGVTDGYVEYSFDGINYIKGAVFKDYISTIEGLPKDKGIKSIRIVVTDENDGPCLCIQDLMICR